MKVATRRRCETDEKQKATASPQGEVEAAWSERAALKQQSKMRLNSIRPDPVGSLHRNGEPRAQARSAESTERIKSSTVGLGGVIGTGTRGRVHGITLRAAAAGRPERVSADAVRAPIVAAKSRNWDGAKGRRKVNR